MKNHQKKAIYACKNLKKVIFIVKNPTNLKTNTLILGLKGRYSIPRFTLTPSTNLSNLSPERSKYIQSNKKGINFIILVIILLVLDDNVFDLDGVDDCFIIEKKISAQNFNEFVDNN